MHWHGAMVRAVTQWSGGVPPVASRLAALRSLTRSSHKCGLAPANTPGKFVTSTFTCARSTEMMLFPFELRQNDAVSVLTA